MYKRQDNILSEAIDEQDEVASRHEEMRKQAEERRARLAAHREAMSGLTAEEKLDYLEAHRDEIFPSSETGQRRPAPSRRWQGPSEGYRMAPSRRWQGPSEGYRPPAPRHPRPPMWDWERSGPPAPPASY